MLATTVAALPTTLTITAWVDALVEAHGFGPRSPYVEGVWGGVLGPSATLCYRRLGSIVAAADDDVAIDVVDLAVSLGLGAGTGRNAMIAKTLARLVAFDVTRWLDDGRYAVRRALAPLPERRVQQLSASARSFHHSQVGR
jgi:hypothetical protein